MIMQIVSKIIAREQYQFTLRLTEDNNYFWRMGNHHLQIHGRELHGKACFGQFY